MAEPFDPTKHLSKLTRRQKVGDGWKNVEMDYLEVKWRIAWFRNAIPNGVIYTEMVSDRLAGEDSEAVFKATCGMPDGGSATGYGSETRGDWKDYREKAETKAIGRALAALGFGTQFTEDFDLDQADDKVVDAPVKRADPKQSSGSASSATNASSNSSRQESAPSNDQRAQAASRTSGTNGTVPSSNGQRPQVTGELATEKQVFALYAIGRTVGMSDADTDDLAEQVMNHPVTSLTKKQASIFMDKMKAMDLAEWMIENRAKLAEAIPAPSTTRGSVSDAQIEAIYSIGATAGRLSRKQIDDHTQATYNKPVMALSQAEASELIDILRQPHGKHVEPPMVEAAKPRQTKPELLKQITEAMTAAGMDAARINAQCVKRFNRPSMLDLEDVMADRLIKAIKAATPVSA